MNLFYNISFTIIDIYVGPSLVHTFEGRSHDPSAGDKLLYPVRRPACDPCTSKERRKEYRRDIEHRIDEARIEVHVSADDLVAVLYFLYLRPVFSRYRDTLPIQSVWMMSKRSAHQPHPNSGSPRIAASSE